MANTGRPNDLCSVKLNPLLSRIMFSLTLVCSVLKGARPGRICSGDTAAKNEERQGVSEGSKCQILQGVRSGMNQMPDMTGLQIWHEPNARYDRASDLAFDYNHRVKVMNEYARYNSMSNLAS